MKHENIQKVIKKLEDIFNERLALYTHYATMRCPAEGKNPAQCARWICDHLPPNFLQAD